MMSMKGCRKSVPHHRHPPALAFFAMVTPDALRTALALHETTELLRCPIQTPACRRDTCARLKPRDFSACPAAHWKSIGLTVPVLPTESSADAWSTRWTI